MKSPLHTLGAVLLLAAAALFAGCAATPRPPAAPKPGARLTPTDRFSGNWQGTWKSASGHHGQLLCSLTPAGPHRYHAHFTAYWLAFHSSYDVDLEAKRTGSILTISGEKNLGRTYGGLYHYTGTIRPGNFEVRYTASSDHGMFLLKRP